jgi:hypothetical protein
MILYEHFNTVTGDGYVGVTKNSIKNRNREHFYLLRKGKHFNPRFQRAFDKYGEKAFQLKIRATFDTVDAMNMAEVETVEKEKNRLYNIAPGGNSGFHELEAKKKIAVALSKPMVSMNIKTGEIREFKSASEAGRNGFNMSNVYAVCRDVARSHNGFVWCYTDIPNYENVIEEKFINYTNRPPKTGPKKWQS